jgi:hypothetical protein
MTPYESEISNLSSEIKRSVVPAGKQENAAIRAEFKLPTDKAFKG